jgi:hypothetical protein
MKLSKRQDGDFTPHDEGSFKAVCVDVTPLVTRQTDWGPKEEFKIVFETDANPREDGSPQCVWSRGFTPSLNEKAALRKFLRQWLGRDLTAAEETEFDTEDLIGRGANVVVVHEQGKDGDKTYANIAACTPMRGEGIKPSGKFTRKKDREEKGGGEGASYRGAAKPTDGTPAAEQVDGTKAGEDWTKVKVHVGKHAGVELRDLDADAIKKLATNWLPVHEGKKKATADDKRLAAALTLANEALNDAPKEDF